MSEPISLATDTTNPDFIQAESVKKQDKEFKFLGMFTMTDFIDYMGAVTYSYWETMRANAFDPTATTHFRPGVFERAIEGVQKLFDQNTGDGTIVAVGFVGAELLSISIDHVAKKLGKKGFDPKIRFLSSLAFGIGLASYIETTHIMNNTIDIPGDLFGVGLGAAFILTSRLAAEHVTRENLDQLSDKTKKFINTAPAKFQQLREMITDKLINREDEGGDDSAADAIAQRFVEVVDQSISLNDINIDTNA